MLARRWSLSGPRDLAAATLPAGRVRLRRRVARRLLPRDIDIRTRLAQLADERERRDRARAQLMDGGLPTPPPRR